MPTYIGHGVSLLAIRVVPGTVHEPRVCEECTHCHKTRTYIRTRFNPVAYLSLDHQNAATNALSRKPGHLGSGFAVRFWLERLSNAQVPPYPYSWQW